MRPCVPVPSIVLHLRLGSGAVMAIDRATGVGVVEAGRIRKIGSEGRAIDVHPVSDQLVHLEQRQFVDELPVSPEPEILLRT